jgi:uncharacterized membrane protein YphA (DoxX/SURF4 family)
MKINVEIPQLFLRLALGLGFIFPVMDRMGWLGLPGEKGNAWGNWDNFIAYTHTLMPYLDLPVVNIIGTIATILEAVFGVALIIGFKTRLAAWGSALLTLAFAVSMLLFAGYRAPFSYSVFVCSAGSLLLAGIHDYKWSVDRLRKN